MPNPNTQGQAGESTGSPGSTGGPTDWEAVKKDYERQLKDRDDQIRGLSKIKQRAEAWDKLAREVGDAVRYDSQTGLPLSWNVEEESSAPAASTADYPFADLGIDKSQMDHWIKAHLASSGYVTQAQAQQLAAQAAGQAYQAAQNRMAIMKSVDKLLGSKDYGDLSKPDSEWSKRTATLIQSAQAGRPGYEGAKGWDEWEFVAPNTLQIAADVAYAQMVREQGQNAASQNQAIQNQAAAALSSSGQGSDAQVPSIQSEMEKVAQSDGDIWKAFKEQTNKAVEAGNLRQGF